MCSPTRASLLTGRNHTRVGNGQICELANDWDGFSGTIPKSYATVAEVLRAYVYKTGAWGKWSERALSANGYGDAAWLAIVAALLLLALHQRVIAAVPA
jgi:arylsulfatase A-like enzyme